MSGKAAEMPVVMALSVVSCPCMAVSFSFLYLDVPLGKSPQEADCIEVCPAGVLYLSLGQKHLQPRPTNPGDLALECRRAGKKSQTTGHPGASSLYSVDGASVFSWKMCKMAAFHWPTSPVSRDLIF